MVGLPITCTQSVHLHSYSEKNLQIDPAMAGVTSLASPGLVGMLVPCLASFPGSGVWAEKKEPETYCLPMLSSLRISRDIGNFSKICSVTLTSAKHADFSWVKDAYYQPPSVWTITTKAISPSFAGIIHRSAHSS